MVLDYMIIRLKSKGYQRMSFRFAELTFSPPLLSRDNLVICSLFYFHPFVAKYTILTNEMHVLGELTKNCHLRKMSIREEVLLFSLRKRAF